MSEQNVFKEGNWLIPKEIATPQGLNSVSIFYRILKRQEEIKGVVNVKDFVNQLSGVMKDFEKFYGDKIEIEDILNNLSINIKRVFYN